MPNPVRTSGNPPATRLMRPACDLGSPVPRSRPRRGHARAYRLPLARAESVRASHSLYGEAISTSLNEQFLQNLVRLRYRESPYFLEVGSVTASLSFESTLGVDAEIATGGVTDLVQPGVGATYANSPTISYAPLQGEEFFRKLMVAVPLESLFVLMQSGWSAARVFGICVERINGIGNAPTASAYSGSPPGGLQRLQALAPAPRRGSPQRPDQV